jgi:hypothetical protein
MSEDVHRLAQLVHDPSPEVLHSVAGDPQLTEELALALLERHDLPAEVLEQLSRHAGLKKNHHVQVALVMHPLAPRLVSFPLLRHLHTFELMQVALTPAVPADVKAACDEAILTRHSTVSTGEKLTLAKRGSGRLAAALLLSSERRIVEAALQNPQLTEALLVKALMRENAPPVLAELASHHPKWSSRREVQRVLLRKAGTPLARALLFARALPTEMLREELRQSRLSANVKAYLLKELHARAQ